MWDATIEVDAVPFFQDEFFFSIIELKRPFKYEYHFFTLVPKEDLFFWNERKSYYIRFHMFVGKFVGQCLISIPKNRPIPRDNTAFRLPN